MPEPRAVILEVLTDVPVTADVLLGLARARFPSRSPDAYNQVIRDMISDTSIVLTFDWKLRAPSTQPLD